MCGALMQAARAEGGLESLGAMSLGAPRLGHLMGGNRADFKGFLGGMSC